MELLPLPTFWFLSHCSLAAGFIPLALELCFVSIRTFAAAVPATAQPGQDILGDSTRGRAACGSPTLMSSALSPRDFLPEVGEDGAGAACEELPELHCVSAGTAGLAPAFPLSHATFAAAAELQQSASQK